MPIIRYDPLKFASLEHVKACIFLVTFYHFWTATVWTRIEPTRCRGKQLGWKLSAGHKGA